MFDSKNSKQFYSHYLSWEDYQNGMYACSWTNEQEHDFILNATKLLTDQDLFYKTMIELLDKWVISSKVNLTNASQNRRAWLGAAACNFKYGIPEIVTRLAWNKLDESTQKKANFTAEKVITGFENNLINKKNAQTLFEY